MDRKADASSTDDEMVRRFCQGDEAAFDQMVLRYRKEIYRVAYRITGNNAEADDLAREAFFKAYRAFKQFRGDSTLKTWLCRIVSNLSLNVIQSARMALDHACALPTDSACVVALPGDELPAVDSPRSLAEDLPEIDPADLIQALEEIYCQRGMDICGSRTMSRGCRKA